MSTRPLHFSAFIWPNGYHESAWRVVPDDVRGVLGGHVGGRRVPAEGILEAAQALAQGLAHLWQALGPEDEQQDDEDECDVNGVIESQHVKAPISRFGWLSFLRTAAAFGSLLVAAQHGY